MWQGHGGRRRVRPFLRRAAAGILRVLQEKLRRSRFALDFMRVDGLDFDFDSLRFRHVALAEDAEAGCLRIHPEFLRGEVQVLCLHVRVQYRPRPWQDARYDPARVY